MSSNGSNGCNSSIYYLPVSFKFQSVYYLCWSNKFVNLLLDLLITRIVLYIELVFIACCLINSVYLSSLLITDE